MELLDARRPAATRAPAKPIATLERVIAANPKHPGALHYWIHLWEPTKTPERAEQEADRLLPLMPGAGHIVHMPAHIYLRVGRYADVVTLEPAAVAGRRGLHHAVPRAGHVSARLLPAQPPLRLAGRDDERAGASSRSSPRARRPPRSSSATRRAAAVRPGFHRRAVLRDGPLRQVGRDPRRAATGVRVARSRGASGTTRAGARSPARAGSTRRSRSSPRCRRSSPIPSWRRLPAVRR